MPGGAVSVVIVSPPRRSSFPNLLPPSSDFLRPLLPPFYLFPPSSCITRPLDPNYCRVCVRSGKYEYSLRAPPVCRRSGPPASCLSWTWSRGVARQQTL
ncbi:hypothetical protein E2C01_057172 [Portunus trituberculatus]|uniref:Uncharacterized protein n=1 Tax=Portunus trituberculatus TaxID=210409 RepID=A0A5B7GZP0_PORTR|nr:hypothetical protein [Portunus trituberculatus]